MQPCPEEILPLNGCPIEVHVILLPIFYHPRSDLSIINGFILKKHLPTTKDCTKINIDWCLFLFKFWFVYNYPGIPQKMKFTKSKFTMFNKTHNSLIWK